MDAEADRCAQCGSERRPEDKYCHECGARLPAPVAAVAPEPESEAEGEPIALASEPLPREPLPYLPFALSVAAALVVLGIGSLSLRSAQRPPSPAARPAPGGQAPPFVVPGAQGGTVVRGAPAPPLAGNVPPSLPGVVPPAESVAPQSGAARPPLPERRELPVTRNEGTRTPIPRIGPLPPVPPPRGIAPRPGPAPGDVRAAPAQPVQIQPLPPYTPLPAPPAPATVAPPPAEATGTPDGPGYIRIERADESPPASALDVQIRSAIPEALARAAAHVRLGQQLAARGRRVEAAVEFNRAAVLYRQIAARGGAEGAQALSGLRLCEEWLQRLTEGR